MVAIDIGMPRACTEVIETQNEKGWIDSSIKNCPLYNVCKHRETIKTNYKPTDCPLIEIGACKVCKHLGVMDCGYYCKLNHWGKISKESNYGGMGDWYCADFERRENENG